MKSEATIYEEISARIKLRVKSLLVLIEDIDSTISELYNENTLVDDRDTRVANKGAIDLQNNIIKSQRQTVDLVVEISKDCLELHRHNASDIKRQYQKIDVLEKDIAPLRKANRWYTDTKSIAVFVSSAIGLFVLYQGWMAKIGGE